MDDCAGNQQASVHPRKIDNAVARMLFASRSDGVDSRNPKEFRNRGDLRFHLRLVFRDRDLLGLHFFDGRKDLLLGLGGVWRIRRGNRREQE
jgi:hypothetical protein